MGNRWWWRRRKLSGFSFVVGMNRDSFSLGFLNGPNCSYTHSLSQICFSRQLSFFVSLALFGNATGGGSRGCQRVFYCDFFWEKMECLPPGILLFSPGEGGKSVGKWVRYVWAREKKTNCSPPPIPTKETDLLSWSRTVYGERSSRKIFSYLPRASISRTWIEEHAGKNTFPPNFFIKNKFK